ncbi:hypothetical protein LOC68_17165 [Blastopirellula sp. JC732]|uniref:Uncharacterized protein n=1 Tax=Blastopirellula sediminis TaxID=2894196 RepID=A0A9X1MNP5_9BACT|nr:hypothetical protein [Blastopirellula sediminis]MCC9606576.1 hypothetical protein [Blastopirellula sediminis]MCC9630126.1 hypothetical protein [Blastopirellula sediminis]
MVMAWVLYVATLLYAAFWFGVDSAAGEFLRYAFHLLRPSTWQDQDYIRGTLQWDCYGLRLARLAMLILLHAGALVWLWLTVNWPIAAAATFASIGVTLSLPWLNERTAPCRVGAERKHFRAVLEAARTLPRLEKLTLEIEGCNFEYQHDEDAPEAFLLRRSKDRIDDSSLGDLGFFLPKNRVAMMLSGEDGFVELLEPGERPGAFEYQLYGVPHHYVHRWSVEYEPGLFFSRYDIPDDEF